MKHIALIFLSALTFSISTHAFAIGGNANAPTPANAPKTPPTTTQGNNAPTSSAPQSGSSGAQTCTTNSDCTTGGQVCQNGHCALLPNGRNTNTPASNGARTTGQ